MVRDALGRVITKRVLSVVVLGQLLEGKECK